MEDWNPHADIDPEGDNWFDEDHMGEPSAMMPDVECLPLREHNLEVLDECTGAEVMFPHGSEHVKVIVKARARDLRNQPIGIKDQNPLLDARECEVQPADGSTEKHSANLTAESIPA